MQNTTLLVSNLKDKTGNKFPARSGKNILGKTDETLADKNGHSPCNPRQSVSSGLLHSPTYTCRCTDTERRPGVLVVRPYTHLTTEASTQVRHRLDRTTIMTNKTVYYYLIQLAMLERNRRPSLRAVICNASITFL